jgi:hypothetical protein
MNLSPFNSVAATYPGFQSLPKGVKQMLLITESVFFEDARPLVRPKMAGARPAGQAGVLPFDGIVPWLNGPQHPSASESIQTG